jgi:molecular chaperone GrpE
VQQADEQAQAEPLRPLLKTLVDLYDALALAGQQVQRVQEAILPSLEQMVAPAESLPDLPGDSQLRPAVVVRPPRFGHWFGRGQDPATALTDFRRTVAEREQRRLQVEEEAGRRRQQAAQRVCQLLDSVVTGYNMSLQRVERTLLQQGLEPIPTVGRPFDPERMEVVDVVTDSDRPAGEVTGELRRGYMWRSRVFRYAQVRVVKP